jgi:hypothetical protein
MSVILQPAGDGDAGDHYVETIENRVPIDRILGKLSEADGATLRAGIRSQDSLPVWGVTPGENDVNKRKWERIVRGDIALFAKSGRVFASAVVVGTVHSKELALELWQENADGETWEYIYFLDEVQVRDIPYATLNPVLGYKPKFRIQGMNVLSEAKSDALIQYFDLESLTYPTATSEAAFNAAVSAMEDRDELDRRGSANFRVEQAFLRFSLFGKSATGRCCICGELLPADLLVAAHVKKRSHCSSDERKDYKNVVVPMCKLGCDDLYEKGYVVIDSQGYVRAGRNATSTVAVERVVSMLSSRKCAEWRSGNQGYFSWHSSHWAKS